MSATFFQLPKKYRHPVGSKFRVTDTGFLATRDENNLSADQRLALVRECTEIPIAVGKNYRGEERIEAMSGAREGVWRAACFFKEGTGANIKTYATYWALSYALKAVRRWRKRGLTQTAGAPVYVGRLDIHRPNDEDGGYQLTTRAAFEDADRDEQGRADRVTLAGLMDRLERFRPDWAAVVKEKTAGATFGAIGAARGVSRQAAEQMYGRALKVLRRWAGVADGD